MRELKSCTVMLANTNYMRLDAGKVYAYNYVANRYLVFFTVKITALGARAAGSSAFKLSCDGHDLIWDAPYIFFGTINTNTLTQHSVIDNGGTWMGPTVAWNANTQMTITGAALMYC